MVARISELYLTVLTACIGIPHGSKSALILGIAFCYIGRYGEDFVEKFGSRFLDTIGLCLCFSFLFFSWPLERYKVTSMHNVHNATHLLMNKVTHS
jgi:hypothetical protein